MTSVHSKWIKIHNIFLYLLRYDLLTPIHLNICNLGLKVSITTHLKKAITRWQHSRHQNVFWEREKKKPDLLKSSMLFLHQQMPQSALPAWTSTPAPFSLSLSLFLLVHVFLSIHQSNFVYERREFKWLNKQKKRKKNPYEQDSLSAYLIMPSWHAIHHITH